MNFGFNETSELGVQRKQLEGNKIHEVTFDGCEMRDIQGVQDASKVFKVLDIKFSNDEGYFTDTIWEPRDNDDQDTPNSFGGFNPSNVKMMMAKFQHLIDAVNPELSAKMRLPKTDPNHKDLSASSWDGLRKLMVEATKPGIGKKTMIKLMDRVRKDQNGNERHESQFPGYFLSYNREGKQYMNTSFIGNAIYWTSKELTRIENAKKATPTPVASTDNSVDDDVDYTF